VNIRESVVTRLIPGRFFTRRIGFTPVKVYPQDTLKITLNIDVDPSDCTVPFTLDHIEYTIRPR
jgi:hypothetical protein